MPAQSPFWLAKPPTGKNVKPPAARGGSAGSSTKAGQAPSGRRKRVVRTAAGARRYKVPIGAEIGTARNAQAAKAQTDKRARNHYAGLVGADDRTKAAAFKWFDDDRLQKLARLTYSFKSADPRVVQLRVGIANEMRRRGMDVNNFGGLGKRTPASKVRTNRPPTRQAKPPRKKAVRQAPPKVVPRPKGKKKSTYVARSNSAAARRKMVALSTPSELRAAIAVFGRVAPDKRQAVARLLVGRAVELSATHFLGQTVIEAANLKK